MVQLARAVLVAVCDGTRSLWRAAADTSFGGSGPAAAGEYSSLPPLSGALRQGEPRDASVEASLVAFAFSCESPVCGDAEEDEDDDAGAHSHSAGSGRSLLPHSCLPAARARVGDDGDRMRRFLQDIWPALLRAPCTGGCAGVTHGLRLAAARSIVTAFAASYGLATPPSQPALTAAAGAGSSAAAASMPPGMSDELAAPPPPLWPIGVLSPAEELRLLATPATIVLLHVAAAAMRGGIASETLLGSAAGGAHGDDDGDVDGDGDGHADAAARKSNAAAAGSAHARSGLEAADQAIASVMRCLQALRMRRTVGLDSNSEGLSFLLPAAYGRALDAATPAAEAAAAPSLSSSLPLSSVALPSCVSAARAAASTTEPPGDLALLQGLLLLSAHSPEARLRGRAYAAFSALLSCYADSPRFRLIAMLLIPPQSPRDAAKAKAKQAPAAAALEPQLPVSPAPSLALPETPLLPVVMTRHVAAAESISSAINRSVQLRGAVLDALRSALAAAAGRWLQAAASGPAGTATSALSVPAGTCSPLLGGEAVALLREIVDARAGMGISQRPWVHALAAAASATARSSASGNGGGAAGAAAAALDLPATAGDTAAEAAALVEQSDIDMSLLSTARLLLLQAQKAAHAAGASAAAGGTLTASDSEASGATDASAASAKRPRLDADGSAGGGASPSHAAVRVATALPPLLAAFAPHGGALAARLRVSYVRPLAAAVRAVQEHFRRQVGAVLLAPHHEPVPAALTSAAPAAASAAAALDTAAVAATAAAAPPASEHRNEDAALLSRLALLDAAIDPVVALLA